MFLGEDMLADTQLVTIVIPVFNGSNFLREAIDSALNQTYKYIEIIVVNDGSNDIGATREVALSYRDKIRYFEKENGGVSSALNFGINMMKGEYFSWLSHDDIYTKDKISTQVDEIKKSSREDTIVYSDCCFLNQNTNTISNADLGKKYNKLNLNDPVFAVTENIIHGCSLLIHKSHFERVGAFREDLIAVQDYEMWYRLLIGQKLVFVDKPLVIGRLHDKQVSVTNPRCADEMDWLYKKFVDELSENAIKKSFGSQYNFYARMSAHYHQNQLQKFDNYPLIKLKSTPMPDNVVRKVSELKKQMRQFSGNLAQNICLFGAGRFGIRILNNLKNRGIKVDFFADNDSKKWGTSINGIKCSSLEEVNKNLKSDTLFIVTVVGGMNDVTDQLKQYGCKYIVSGYELDKMFAIIPPIKSEIDFSIIDENRDAK